MRGSSGKSFGDSLRKQGRSGVAKRLMNESLFDVLNPATDRRINRQAILRRLNRNRDTQTNRGRR